MIRERPWYIHLLPVFHGFNFLIYAMVVIYILFVFIDTLFIDPSELLDLAWINYAYVITAAITSIASINMIRHYVLDRERSRWWAIVSSITFLFFVNVVILISGVSSIIELQSVVLYTAILHLITVGILFIPYIREEMFVNPPDHYVPEVLAEEV